MTVSPGGDLQLTATTLRMMIRTTSRPPLQEFQLVGGPEWVATDRFDVVAKAAGTASQPEVAAMLRTLLVDRFRLRLRTEQRELPIYALRPWQSDRMPGPKLSRSNTACAAAAAGPPKEPAPSICGFTIRNESSSGSIAGRGTGMKGFAIMLSQFVGRAVIEETGLSGEFNLDLTWLGPSTATADTGSASGSFLTALREQLGLTLDATQGMVEVHVIESVERPTLP